MKIKANSVLSIAKSIDSPVATDVQNPKKIQVNVNTRKEGRIVFITVFINITNFIVLVGGLK